MAGAPTPPASVGARPAVTSCSLLGMDSLSVPASESGWVSPSHVCRHLPDACVEGLCPGLHRGPGPPPDAAPSLGSKWCEEESQASCFYLLVSALQVTCWLVFSVWLSEEIFSSLRTSLSQGYLSTLIFLLPPNIEDAFSAATSALPPLQCPASDYRFLSGMGTRGGWPSEIV